MKYNLPDRVFHEIKRFAKKYDINKVVLFGSRAVGNHTDRSDIDLAVWGGDFDGFYWEIRENAHTLLKFDIIDAESGISDDLSEELKKKGVVLYEKA